MQHDEKSGFLHRYFSRLTSDDHRVRIVVIAGLLGMALLLLSGLWGGGQNKSKADVSKMANTQQYTQQYEKRLAELLGQIEGVGRAQVMITLENGVETVYAQDEKQCSDKTTSYAGQIPDRVNEKEEFQQSIVMVGGQTGGKNQALVLTQRDPTPKGVIVVCPGASSAAVRTRVIEAVTTVLGIGFHQVCVVPSVK